MYSEMYKNFLKIWSDWYYSSQSGHPNFSSEWWYSGQNVGVIKLQHVGVIVSPLFFSEKVSSWKNFWAQGIMVSESWLEESLKFSEPFKSLSNFNFEF